MENAESKLSSYFFFVYIAHTVLISWRAKVVHIERKCCDHIALHTQIFHLNYKPNVKINR